jgi:hypothetical protein
MTHSVAGYSSSASQLPLVAISFTSNKRVQTSCFQPRPEEIECSIEKFAQVRTGHKFWYARFDAGCIVPFLLVRGNFCSHTRTVCFLQKQHLLSFRVPFQPPLVVHQRFVFLQRGPLQRQHHDVSQITGALCSSTVYR